MTKEEHLKGIAAYETEQAELLALIDAQPEGRLTAHRFDDEYKLYCVETDTETGEMIFFRKKPALRIWPTSGSAFLLGDMSGGDWSKWLDLLQHMVMAKIVKIVMVGEAITYERNEASD